MDGHPQATVVLFPFSLSQSFKKATLGITLFVCLFHLFLVVILLQCITRGGALHDRSQSSVARDESRTAGAEPRIAGGEPCMSRGEPRMARGEPHMTGDYCLPEQSIHRCVRTHSH